jgi:hypothetical protein
MKFEFKMDVSQEDFLAFYKNYIRRTVLKTRNIVIYSIFLLFLVVGPLVAQDYELLIYAGLFLVILYVLYIYIDRSGKKIYAKNTHAFDMKYILEEDQLQFVTDEGTGTKLWSEFYSIYEEEKYLFLYLKNKRGLVFVKDQMTKEGVDYLIKKSSASMRSKEIQLLEK